MKSFKNASIRYKLNVTVIGTTATALFIAFLVLGVNETLTARESLVANAGTLAKIIGSNSSAALVFDDGGAAEETLSALSSEPEILAAAIYDGNGTLFATYRATAGQALPELASTGSSFGAGKLSLFHPIHADAERIGTVYICSTTRAVTARLQAYVAILLAVLLVAAVIALVVVTWLQRHIVGPMTALVGGSEAMAQGNLSTIVQVESSDEVGVLAKAFNGMAGSLGGLVSQVRDNIHAVARVTEALEQTSERVVAETRRQGATVDEAGDSIIQVTSSIQRVNASVGELSATSRRTASSISNMSASIGGVAGHMDQLAGAIETTSSAIAGLTTNVREIAGSVKTLDEASETTEESLGELNASVHQVRENAKRSQEASQGAHREAARGMQSMGDTIRSMQEIESSFNGLKDVISRLAQRSDSIGNIVKVIEDVADETQLLSLNAAIIASQAGEQGDAFAVVADEVKNLAERTGGSTREISALTEGIRRETEQLVDAMNAGSDKVEQGVARSAEAGDRLRAIMESATLSKEMVEEILQATEGQAADLHRVEDAMAQVRGFVKQIQKSTDSQSHASNEIAAMVEQVRALGHEVKGATVAQTSESQRIAEAVELVTRMIDQIMEATQEQQRGSARIDAALEVFRDVALESGRSVEEMRRVMASLADRSEQLDQEIGRFTL